MSFEQFLVDFNALKSCAAYKPKNLRWLPKTDAEAERLVLKLWAAAFAIRRQMAVSRRKSSYVPDAFVEGFREYTQGWAEAVDSAVAESITRQLENIDLDRLPRAASDEGTRDQDLVAFDILADDAAECVSEVFAVAEDIAQQWQGRELGDTLNKALGAWSFFENTIGLDLPQIFRRWRNAPHVLVSNTNARGSMAAGSEFDLLLDEAWRAFVFGAFAAAVAMCRALTELILEARYGIHYEGPNKLKELIVLAERQHHWMKRLKLHEKRKAANEVLHTGRAVEEEMVRRYLETLRTLIEGSPQHGRV